MKFEFWLIFGLVGQIMFSLRFLVQWIASERENRSIIPISFWYFSLGGSAILAAYAIHRRVPVCILGQTFGTIIYLRNLVVIHRTRNEGASSPRGNEPDAG